MCFYTGGIQCRFNRDPNDSIDLTAVTMNAVVKGKDNDGERRQEVADVVSFPATERLIRRKAARLYADALLV